MYFFSWLVTVIMAFYDYSTYPIVHKCLINFLKKKLIYSTNSLSVHHRMHAITRAMMWKTRGYLEDQRWTLNKETSLQCQDLNYRFVSNAQAGYIHLITTISMYLPSLILWTAFHRSATICLVVVILKL